MDGKSANITEEKLNKLKEIIPEAFTENKIDWEKLKAALGEDIEFNKTGFYHANDTEISLILEKIDMTIIQNVLEATPQKVITLDRLFNNNDQLKTNTALQMKDAGIEFKVV